MDLAWKAMIPLSLILNLVVHRDRRSRFYRSYILLSEITAYRTAVDGP